MLSRRHAARCGQGTGGVEPLAQAYVGPERGHEHGHDPASGYARGVVPPGRDASERCWQRWRWRCAHARWAAPRLVLYGAVLFETLERMGPLTEAQEHQLLLLVLFSGRTTDRISSAPKSVST